MQIPNNYYFLRRDYLNKVKNYSDLNIDEKIDLLNFELALNGINVKVPRFHTKAEEKASKQKYVRKKWLNWPQKQLNF